MEGHIGTFALSYGIFCSKVSGLANKADVALA